MMRLLASGVDTLNLSVRGTVREPVWDLLAEVQGRARLNEDLEPFSFPTTEEAFGCRPYGWRGYTYWLSSPDYEVMVGRSAKFPAVLVQLHSAFLHSMGIDPALDQVERLLRLDVVAGAFKEGFSVSTCTRTCRDGSCARLTSTASLATAGIGGPSRTTGKCSSRAKRRASCSARMRWWHGSTTRLPRSARTASAGSRTSGGRLRPGSPVWRVEFQFRREALADFH